MCSYYIICKNMLERNTPCWITEDYVSMDIGDRVGTIDGLEDWIVIVLFIPYMTVDLICINYALSFWISIIEKT